MEEYVQVIPRETTDSAFHQAVLAVHKENFQGAQQVWWNGASLEISLFLRPYISKQYPGYEKLSYKTLETKFNLLKLFIIHTTYTHLCFVFVDVQRL